MGFRGDHWACADSVMERCSCHYAPGKRHWGGRGHLELSCGQALFCSVSTALIASCDRHLADSVYNSRPPFTKVDITWHANPQERQPRESNRRQWKLHSQSKSKPVCSSSPATKLKSSSQESAVSLRWLLINISNWEINQRLRDTWSLPYNVFIPTRRGLFAKQKSNGETSSGVCALEKPLFALLH